MRQVFKFAILGAAMMATSPALAITTAPSDTISSLYLSGPENYGYRGILSNPASLSNCTNAFVYINASEGNYQAYVATLTSAYIAHKNVQIRYEIVNGFCHLVEFGVSG